ncbi:hypothetical protein [Spirillospora sp. NPDC047279]|uniref:hypothetical protein n=1 Tax=Spirillospora sp. NPDC047279 TaxID=3155478 RepID=UPI00340EE8E6
MEFRIVALGLPNAGKSVYLSTLHHELINSLAPGVVLTVPLDERKRLTRIYDAAADPRTNSWPAATRANAKMHESKFTCSVASRRGGAIRLLDFSYVDYAGEWLTEPSEGSSLDQDLQDQIEKANVLLGIIDGRRLLEYLAGDISPHVYFYTRIRPVAEHMRAFAGPIHFVISKWDLLRHTYTLAEVRSRLFESQDAPWLREMVQTRTARQGLLGRTVGTVRLIPVSSMGDFAYLDGDGNIKKNVDRAPEPCNVPVPLVAVIPDLVGLALAQPATRQKQSSTDGSEPGDPATRIKSSGEAADSLLKDGSAVKMAPPPPAPAPNVGLGAGGLLGTAGGVRVAAMVAVMIGVPVGQALNRAGRRAARRTRRRYRRLRATELSRVKSYESGLFYVMHHFTERLKTFDRDYPDSLLS